MHLYFLRHGEASWPDWKKPDDERPLTPHGKEEIRKLARFFQRLDLQLDRIMTSPLPRARQTAEIVAERLKLTLHEDSSLEPGFDGEGLRKILRKYPEERVMLVGHEPDFTEAISALTGASLKLSKGGLALIELNPKSMSGRLLWLFPPKVVKAAC
jgi:phosphohistidine phosphatase